VPFSVTVVGQFNNPPLYWRVRTKDALVEVGVSATNGLVRSLVLTAISSSGLTLSTDSRHLPVRTGVPRVDTSIWRPRPGFESRFVEVNAAPALVRGDSEATLYLSDARPASWTGSSRVRFGVTASSHLCGVQLCSLSPAEIRTIAEGTR
ncbi:MAG: hypothetical protein AAGE52_42270, partial [Myxococcota bacterium]